MSFEHRFGAGIGGSYEDPYIPPCCDDCEKDCEGSNYSCDRYRSYLGGLEEYAWEQMHEPPEDFILEEEQS